MSTNYTSVLWNNQKRKYDLLLWGAIVLFMVSYILFQLMIKPEITVETLIIRSFGITAFMLLHFILIIGPLCRIDNRFLPLLYNRRHAGVSMFLLAATHGIFSIIQFHSLGNTNPVISIFTSNKKYLEISEFPFQTLGFFALIILFLMAATSHDFWLKNLTPKIWKSLHMGVYLAYILIIFHVATGALQYENHPVNWIFLFCGFIITVGMHLFAGFKEINKVNREVNNVEKDGFVAVGDINEIQNNRGKSICINGQNIAIFKYDGKLSAVDNLCRHQLGPLGEGKIIDGCITCPWHGYQYLPENGQSPPPFEEKINTYSLRLVNNIVYIHPDPHPEGTYLEPVKIINNEA